jgi:hypothetical protein
MVASYLSLLCPIFSDVRDQKIQILDVATACAMVSHESGRRIQAQKGLAGKLLMIIRHPGCTPEELLKGIEEATEASCEPSASGEVLKRGPAELDKIRNHRTAVRLAWIDRQTKLITEYRKHQEAAGSSPAEELNAALHEADDIAVKISKRQTFSQGKTNFLQLLPSQELLLNVAQKVGWTKIASQKSGITRILETPKSALADEDLPPMDDLLEQYKSKALRWENLNLDEQSLYAMAQMGASPAMLGLGTRNTIARLRLQVSAATQGIFLTLEGFNSIGTRVLLATFHAGPADELRHPVMVMKEAERDPRSVWLPLSEGAKAALKFVSNSNPRSAPNWFSNPDKLDPLSVFSQEALLRLEDDSTSHCTVLTLSDSLWNDSSFSMANGSLNLAAFKQFLQEWTPFEKVQSAGAVVYRPLDPEFVESQQANRRALKRFVSDYAVSSESQLRQVAKFYAGAASPQSTELSPLVTFWGGITPRVGSRFPATHDMPAGFLEIVGAIPDDQWQSLLNGTAVTADQLGVTDQLLRYLRQDPGLTFSSPPSDLRRHALENFESDSIGQALFTVTRRITPVFCHLTNGVIDHHGWQSEKAFFYADVLPREAITHNGKDFKLAWSQEDFNRFMAKNSYQFGEIDGLTIHLELVRGIFIEHHFSSSPTSISDVTAYDNLPDHLKKDLWDQMSATSLEEAAFSYNLMRNGGSSNTSQSETPVSPPIKP